MDTGLWGNLWGPLKLSVPRSCPAKSRPFFTFYSADRPVLGRSGSSVVTRQKGTPETTAVREPQTLSKRDPVFDNRKGEPSDQVGSGCAEVLPDRQRLCVWDRLSSSTVAPQGARHKRTYSKLVPFPATLQVYCEASGREGQCDSRFSVVQGKVKDMS